ncbi:MAG: quinol:electron acceptor oxidoreductase subunit ActD [Terriglobia bacterium]
MGGRNTAVFGVYTTHTGAQSGADALRAAGFRATDTAMLIPENQGSKDFAHEKHTKAPEGVMTGVVIGGIIGGILGGLLGSGAIVVPQWPMLAAGTVVAALAGAGALMVVGFIIGALTGLGRPEFEARRYQGRKKRGGILLSVHCDDSRWSKLAKKALKMTGAEGISEAREAGADYAETDKPLPRAVSGGSPEL